MDRTAVSQNTRNLAGDTAITKNNRPKMNIVQHSCDSSDAGDARIVSACQTDRERKQRWDAVFDANDANDSRTILLHW